MDSFFKVLLTESPTWVQISVFMICILGLIVIFVFFILGAYRFATAVNKESKAFDLSKSNQELVRENEKLKDQLQTFMNLIESMSNVMEVSSKKLMVLHKKTFDKVMQSWAEEDSGLLAKTISYFLRNMTDIIHSSLNLAANEVNYQNRGRLSLWSLDKSSERKGKYLRKIYRSVQFNYSQEETNELHIDESIAGRAYRTKIDQIVLDLNSDPDWNKVNSNTYKAIAAYPIGNHRVLTVDFKKVPDQKEQDFIKQVALYLDYLYSYRDNIYDFIILVDMMIKENGIDEDDFEEEEEEEDD